MVSVQELLEKKIIKPGDPSYGFVPLMALWSLKCPKCDAYLVSSHRIGVSSRYDGHMRKEHYPDYGLSFESGRCFSCKATYDLDVLTDGKVTSLKHGKANCPKCGKELKPYRR